MGTGMYFCCRWVVAECLDRVAGDYEGQRVLLNYGLKETARHCQSLSTAGWDSRHHPSHPDPIPINQSPAMGRPPPPFPAHLGPLPTAPMSKVPSSTHGPSGVAQSAGDAAAGAGFEGFNVGSPDSDSGPCLLTHSSIPGLSAPLPDWARDQSAPAATSPPVTHDGMHLL